MDAVERASEMMKIPIGKLRINIINEIYNLWPKEQKYVMWDLPFCATIKYLEKDKTFGTNSYINDGMINPTFPPDLPLDALVILLEKLKELNDDVPKNK